MEMMTNEWLLDCRYLATSLCILYRNKRMNEDKMVAYLLLFALFYFTMHVMMGYLEGRL